MIEVTKLNGKKYWINPHQIESMEENPDLTITLLSGKTIVIKENPEQVIDRVIKYRQRIGIYKQEL